ncbi:MAG TPA: DUF4136 domain-containing protein [Candidatus Acidoferrum sp.]|nr:DUF4136 domain-containing protein [Candidatus Acidoferrum sp.]
MTTGEEVLCLSWKKEKAEMKKSAFLASVVFALVLPMFSPIGVVAQDVRYDFDKNKDFSKYKTYKWVPIKGADQPDDLTGQKLTAAVNAELAAKGLTMTDSDNADLYIGYQTAIGTEKQFTSYNTGWGYGPGWGGGWYGYGGGMSSTTYGSTSTVYVGQLDLSIYDPAAKQMVWRGTATKTLDPKAKPEKKEKNISKAVKKLLKNYPPTPKS